MKKYTRFYLDHEKISLGESRLLWHCWYQLYKCQLKVRHGKNPILPQNLPSQRRVFLCFMSEENSSICTSDREKETNFFCFPGGHLQKWPSEGFHPHFFLPYLVIVWSYSSAICILNQHEIFLRGLDGNCPNNIWNQTENFFKDFQKYDLVLFLSLSREAWCSSTPESSQLNLSICTLVM